MTDDPKAPRVPNRSEPPSEDASATGARAASARSFAGRYEVRSLLGSGAMGTVYLAYDRELDEEVALKVLRETATGKPLLVDLLRREVKLARRIAHPNVARVFDIGESDGTKFLTMEYVAGPSLARVIERERNLPLDRLVEIARSLCAGLQAAHAASVLHLDLKPDNVLLDERGRVVITDFGLARSFHLSASKFRDAGLEGTPAYMAPEQIESAGDLDARADIFALGVSLFEALTGELPFHGETPLAMAAARLTTPPKDPRQLRPDVPEGIARLILRCLSKDREARFANVAEVAAALDVSPAALAKTALIVDEPTVHDRPVLLPAAPKSLAVLAFRHADTDEDAMIADGLCDDLIDALACIDGLHVRNRSILSSLRNVDALEVGRRLGVDAVVFGTLRRNEGALRVSARLVSVAGAFELWSDRFEAQTSALFTLSDAITSGIAAALGVAPAAPPRHALADPRAVELYLLARKELTTSLLNDPERAAKLFDLALERAPDDATLLAGSARANVRAWFFAGPGSDRARERAFEAATRAIELAPHLSEPRHALATWYLHEGDAGRAVAELRSILNRSDFVPAYETLGAIANEVGQTADARHYLDRALTIDPSSAHAVEELARLDALEGRWSNTEAWLSRLASLDPERAAVNRTRSNQARARYAFWRRDEETAIANLDTSEKGGPVPVSILEAMKGTRDSTALRSVFAASGKRVGSKRRMALLHQLECESACFFRDPQWALEAFGRAAAEGLIDVSWVRKCPLLDVIREDPGYPVVAELVEKRAARIVRIMSER